MPMSAIPTYTPGDSQREIELVRIFDAPRELVFRAWTDPQHLARWWGPEHFTNPVCEVDARVGGTLRIVMRAPDGNDYPMRGVFKEVVRPERLVFTNIAVDAEDRPIIEGLTTVLFAAEGQKTRVTLRTRGKAVAPVAIQYLQGMEMGWSQSLTKLAALLPEL